MVEDHKTFGRSGHNKSQRSCRGSSRLGSRRSVVLSISSCLPCADQELADEAFRDFLQKDGRPTDLKAALREGAKGAGNGVRGEANNVLCRRHDGGEALRCGP
jgi:hypothetical protein